VLPDGSGEAAAHAIGATAGRLLISGCPVSDLWHQGLLPPERIGRSVLFDKALYICRIPGTFDTSACTQSHDGSGSRRRSRRKWDAAAKGDAAAVGGA
jgi:hypothetical protein